MGTYDDAWLRGRLEQFRKDHGLKPVAWSRAAGLSGSTYKNFLENPNASIKWATLVKLAEAAGSDIWALLGVVRQEKGEPEFDADLMKTVIAGIQKELALDDLELAPDDLAAASLEVYRLLRNVPEEKRADFLGTVINLVVRCPYTDKRK